MTLEPAAPAADALPPGCELDPELPRYLAERTPAQQALGARLIGFGPRSATLGIGWRADLIEEASSRGLAAGAISTALDQASGLALMLAFNGRRTSGGTVELRLEFLQTPRAAEPIHAHADWIGSTAHAAFLRCTAYHPASPEDLIVTGSTIYITEPGRPDFKPPDAGIGEPLSSAVQHDATLSAYPYFDFLGLRRVEDGVATLMLPASFRHVNNVRRGSLHGGIVVAVLHTAGLDYLREQQHARVATLSFTTQFLRRAEVRDTWASVSIVRQGRRMVTLDVHAWQDSEERTIAVGHGQFSLA